MQTATHAIPAKDTPTVRFVLRADLPGLFQRAQHHVYFHIQNVSAEPRHFDLRAHYKGITTAELAKCLPWIPLNSAIFLYSSTGYSSLLLVQLAALPTNRELFLVKEED